MPVSELISWRKGSNSYHVAPVLALAGPLPVFDHLHEKARDLDCLACPSVVAGSCHDFLMVLETLNGTVVVHVEAGVTHQTLENILYADWMGLRLPLQGCHPALARAAFDSVYQTGYHSWLVWEDLANSVAVNRYPSYMTALEGLGLLVVVVVAGLMLL